MARYASPIELISTETIRAIAIVGTGAQDAILSATYFAGNCATDFLGPARYLPRTDFSFAPGCCPGSCSTTALPIVLYKLAERCTVTHVMSNTATISMFAVSTSHKQSPPVSAAVESLDDPCWPSELLQCPRLHTACSCGFDKFAGLAYGSF